jgi:D-sedoheptulose 7-phosphate isomerase
MTGERLRRSLDEHQAVARELASVLPAIEELGAAFRAVLAGGGRILAFGNGGSAAEAQHLAAELIGRAKADRDPLPAVALVADASSLTAIANDYGFAEVFARQVRALATRKDLVVGITTSGRSENVIRGLEAGHKARSKTALLTGAGGVRAAALADYAVVVPSSETSRVQEMHVLVVHLLCEIVDEWAVGVDEGARPPHA